MSDIRYRYLHYRFLFRKHFDIKEHENLSCWHFEEMNHLWEFLDEMFLEKESLIESQINCINIKDVIIKKQTEKITKCIEIIKLMNDGINSLSKGDEMSAAEYFNESDKLIRKTLL